MAPRRGHQRRAGSRRRVSSASAGRATVLGVSSSVIQTKARLLTGTASHSAGTTMTRANAAVSGVTLVIGLVAIAMALPRAQAGAPAKPAGGGDANPTAVLFIEQCSG